MVTEPVWTKTPEEVYAEVDASNAARGANLSEAALLAREMVDWTLEGLAATAAVAAEALTTAQVGSKPPKQSVRLLVTTNVNLATDAENGDTYDGETLATGDRIGKAYLWDTTGHATNGVWVVQASGAAVRAADMDSETDIVGAFFNVDAGTHASETWAIETKAPITVDTTAIKMVPSASGNATTAEVTAGRQGEANLAANFTVTKAAAAAADAKAVAVGARIPALTSYSFDFTINDQWGLSAVGLRSYDLAWVVHALEVYGETRLQIATDGGMTGWAFPIMDGSGAVAGGWKDDGAFSTRVIEDLATINGTAVSSLGAPTYGDFTLAEANYWDQWAQAVGRERRAVAVTGIQAATTKYLHIIVYGQSYPAGARSWPILTDTAIDGTWMIGASEHWVARGDTPALEPLVGTIVSGSTVLADALSLDPASASQKGESHTLTAARILRRRLLAKNGLDPDDVNYQIIVTNCAVSGATLEDLSKGADPDRYSTIGAAIVAGKALAVADSGTYSVLAIVMHQGQSNYLQTGGATNTQAGWLALIETLYEDVTTDFIEHASYANQVNPPAWFLISPAAQYMRDAGNLGIANAHIEFARNTPGVYIVGTDYHVTDRAAHLDVNGSRWLGTILGNHMCRVLVDAKHTEALMPIYDGDTPQAYWRGQTIILPLSANGPLKLLSPYRERTISSPDDYPALGFAVRDGSTAIPVTSVTILPSALQINLGDTPTAAPLLRCAGESTFAGYAYVQDTSLIVAEEEYTYETGTGMEAAENIAALVDKPYPAGNPIIPFDIQTIAV